MRLRARHLPLAATAAVFAALYATASLLYPGFCSLRVASNLLADNAVLGITALGTTFVIFAGGIDLSVGSVVGFTSILVATLIGPLGVPPALAWLAALALGALFGAGMGGLIRGGGMEPFLVTLAGLFFARGAAFWVNEESVGITHPLCVRLANFGLQLGGGFTLTMPALIFLGVLAAALVLAHGTRFGRNCLALGGSEQSALLMGLPVGRTKLAMYALGGFCAALAGITATLYTGSGNPATGVGLELDAIAAVVIGGTLLTGGRGYVLGTFLGVMILGTIQSALLFDGRLNSWWLRIVEGVLLLLFILLQRFLVKRGRARPA